MSRLPLLLLVLLLFTFSATLIYADAGENEYATTNPPVATKTPTTAPTTRPTTAPTTPPTQAATQAPATLTPTTLAPTTAPTTAPTMLPSTVAPTTPPPPTPTVPPTTAATASAVPCGNRNQCSTCTVDGLCSWCAETSTCVAQQNPSICSARGWRTVPPACAAPPVFNPFLQLTQAATQLAQLGTVNATNTFWANNAPLMNLDPVAEFVYIQLDVLNTNAPRALVMHLFVVQKDGTPLPLDQFASSPTTRTTPTSFLTIRPAITREICNNNKNAQGTCTFMLSVTSDTFNAAGANRKLLQTTNIDTNTNFKLSFTRGRMVVNLLSTQIVEPVGLVNDTVAFFGLEFPVANLDVKIALIPDQNNPTTDLDLFVTNMNTANTPLFTGKQGGRGTNQASSFIINSPTFAQAGGGLFMIAVVPAQIDKTRKVFTLNLIRNFKQENVIPLTTLAIIAAVAVLVLCIFTAIAVIAKRRRRALLAAQAAAAAAQAAATPPPEPQGVTPEELELIPVHSFEKNSEAASDDSLCSICLCDYDVGQPVRTLACLHHFHTSCVDPWLKDHRTCPNCRKDATEGLKSGASSSKGIYIKSEQPASAGPQVVFEPIQRPGIPPLPSPRGQIPSITHTGSGSGSHYISGSTHSQYSPRSAASQHVITPVEIESPYPQYAATQSTGSSSSRASYPAFSPPHDQSLSARRLSRERAADMWQDTPGTPQGQI